MRSNLLNPSHRSYKARIKSSLMLEIGRGAVDDRLPPESQLAERFHVNRLTINSVMAELQREGHVRRIRGKGTFVCRPVPVSESTQSPRTRCGRIVIAYPDYYSFDLWSKVNVAEDLAHQREIELTNFKMDRQTAYKAVAALIRRLGSQVRGAILLPPAAAISASDLSLVNRLGVPIVVLAACDPGHLGENTFAVHRDYLKEGRMVMECLLRAGHRRIGYISNEPPSLGSEMKLQGAVAALRQFQLDEQNLVRSPDGVRPWTSSMEAGYRFALHLLHDATITALMCCSPAGAIGAMRAASERGRRVPADLSLIAMGQELLEGSLAVPLTTTRTDQRAMLATAFDMILDSSRPRTPTIVTDAELVERESVRTVR